MKNLLRLDYGTPISEIQHQFSEVFPFLRLNFYRYAKSTPGLDRNNKILPATTRLRAAGLSKAGEIEIREDMLVSELEQQLSKDYGLSVQVLRQSGAVWLETTMTDSWTLGQQNQHGQEISRNFAEKVPGSSEDFDLGRGNL